MPLPPRFLNPISLLGMNFLPNSLPSESCYICDFLIFMFQQVERSLLKKHKTSASLLYPEDSRGTKNSQRIS